MPTLSQHQSNDFTKISLEDVVAYFNRPITLNEHGCWIWLGPTDNRGYGRSGQSVVYGIVWRMAGRDIPIGHELRHKCANRACINPDHICTGTHKENMQDAAALNVMGHGPRKLSDRDYREMFDLLDNGFTKAEVGRLYNVSPALMTKLTKGELKYAELVRASKQ